MMTSETPRVLFNASSCRVGGGLSYALRQLGSVEDADLDLTVLASPWNIDRIQAETRREVIELSVANAGQRFAYEQILVPIRFRQSVLHFVGNFGALTFGARRSVVVIQNPNYFGIGRSQAANRPLNRRLKIGLAQLGLRRAAKAVSISQSLHEQIISDQPHVAKKVSLIRSGAPVLSEVQTPVMSVPAPFVLSLANDYPHKRLEFVARVWDLAETAGELVFAGDISPRRRSAIRSVCSTRDPDDIIFLGPVSNSEQVSWLLHNASCLFAPSALEAHPLTPAEAGAAGCPLLLSDIAPHVEVAGQHATFVPTEASAAAWAAALDKATTNDRKTWQYEVTWEQHGIQLENLWREVWAEMAT